MSTIVYQSGLPSFLDTQINESRTLRLKLSSPRSHIPHSIEMVICTVLDSESKIPFKENIDIINQNSFNSLSFIQTVTNVAHLSNECQTVYIHPLVKRASSLLSDKSLELCTENLGSETGTDVIEDENVIFSSRKIFFPKTNVSSRRMLPKKTFPPPLSTMMGSEKVQVKSIRENGRLILKAVKVQPKVSCFEVDRSNGRLRLWFVDVENSSSFKVSATGQGSTESSSRDCSESDSKF